MQRLFFSLALLMALSLPPLARAEITLRGEASFGLGLEGDGKIRPKNHAQFDFGPSVITDNGLKFGATLRATSRSGLQNCQGPHCGPSGTQLAPGMIYFETGH